MDIYFTNIDLKNLFVIFILFVIFTNSNVFGQEECGVSFSPDIEIDINNFNEYRSNFTANLKSTNIIKYLPIQLHIITDDEGTINSNLDNVLHQIELANTYFSIHNIQFFVVKEVNYVHNSNLIVYDHNLYRDSVICFNVPNAINIYYFKHLTMDSNNYGGLATYPWYKEKYVMINNEKKHAKTLAHELGHFLGLYHTHETRYFGSELASGNNCNLSGDLICDTPADPELGYSNLDSSCVYIGDEKDSVGDRYDPDPSILMSYGYDCRSKFTKEQGIRMHYYIDYYFSDIIKYENSSLEEIVVYPNPCNTFINIKGSNNHTLKLYDLSGKHLQSYNDKNRLDLSGLDIGIYILEIKKINSQEIIRKKIIISR